MGQLFVGFFEIPLALADYSQLALTCLVDYLAGKIV